MKIETQYSYYNYYIYTKLQTNTTNQTLMHNHTQSQDLLHIVAWKEPSLLVHHSFVPIIIVGFENIYDGTFRK